MTCWIIHWAFAVEQMEGQTHTQTCSLAHSYTLLHSCIYFYTHMHVLNFYKNVFTLRHTHASSFHTPGALCLFVSFSTAVDTRGASCQHRPCSLIPPSNPLTIWTEKNVTRYRYLFWLLILISGCALFYCIAMDLLGVRWYFKHHCQATGILMQLYYFQSRQSSAVRI